ncbi:D-glucarate permease [Salmonella enterica subsp. arizonae]|uniref:D-glucarate permease n=1 Tax=Salmonella enterica subsp. arizonae TaxID=59203 RepID=A0A2X4TI58_SALER|nr:D-glucarate permease [Salmonella enterica subsp. arizonae]
MSSLSHAASSAENRTNARYWIVVMLFIVTSFNYGDRGHIVHCRLRNGQRYWSLTR